MDEKDGKKRILEAVIDLFNDKGLRFTMSDVAKAVGMSKKTLYVYFRSKEDLMLQMTDYCFKSIKDSEAKIISDPTLPVPEKIRRILGVLPERYLQLDLTQLSDLKTSYPSIYRRVEEHLENDWEPTIHLLMRGMEEGSVRKINIPVFKMMLEASIEQFFRRDILAENHMTYYEGLQEVVGILVDGILVKS
ncbi:MAG: TetR/AcrR family transcriptional regulator [Lachnospiraceae bacterium]|nr:TetR/AcrR family transcriptional regulator [Lachnospiraceae bacterium]